jgi:GalNAc-alpha-(1->4)-GalNAc-alpha-(1->3)-diNAcBac-PP-undecaprenol alpha-1,4-N-acetyl-D-galactosaminyltransferase
MPSLKRFITIVPHAENLELRKDPGQVPYHFYKTFGFEATLVTYFYSLQGGRNEGPVNMPPKDRAVIDKNYPFLASEVPGLKIHFLENLGRGKFYEKAIFQYIKNNAKNIDILNLFHFNMENICYSFLYKLINPSGKIYLKLDIDLNYYRSKKHFFNLNTPFPFFKIFFMEKIFYPLFFSIVQVVSAESELGRAYFSKRFSVPSKKMTLLPNGVDEERIMAYHKSKPDNEKQDVIITVGRIGTVQKNNEMLLSAISGMDLKEWRVYFIGAIEPAFYQTIDKFYKSNPALKKRVFFTGKIDDPAALYDYYSKAKIFCLTSLEEGFPLSACEAAFFGDYLVLAESIYCFNELTDNGRYGISTPTGDIAQLKSSLQHIINHEKILADKGDEIKDYARRKLSWQVIIPRLKSFFEDKEQNVQEEIF